MWSCGPVYSPFSQFTIHGVPKRSATMPNPPAAQNVFSNGMCTSPPAAR